jgi:hypothetical protein
MSTSRLRSLKLGVRNAVAAGSILAPSATLLHEFIDFRAELGASASARLLALVPV